MATIYKAVQVTKQAFTDTAATATITASRKIIFSADQNCYITLDGSTATSTNGFYLPASTPYEVECDTASLGVIRATVNGTLNITVLG